VTVRYGTNHDAKRWGFDLLGLPCDLKSLEGFPVFEASLDDPTPGYGTRCSRPNPPRTDETWTAWTSLTICPDVGRTKRLAPVMAAL